MAASPYLTDPCVPMCIPSDVATVVSTTRDANVCNVIAQRQSVTQRTGAGAAQPALTVTGLQSQVAENTAPVLVTGLAGQTAVNLVKGNLVVAGSLTGSGTAFYTGKIVAITAGAGPGTLTAEQSGTVFTISGIVTSDIVLPAAAPGLVYEFFVLADNSTFTIRNNGDSGTNAVLGGAVLIAKTSAHALMNAGATERFLFANGTSDKELAVAGATTGDGPGGHIKFEAIKAEGAGLGWIVSGFLSTNAGTPATTSFA
jgi:hypothetical protein